MSVVGIGIRGAGTGRVEVEEGMRGREGEMVVTVAMIVVEKQLFNSKGGAA